MNIVRAFPCLTPFPAEFFRILTPGASWRPKADHFPRILQKMMIFCIIMLKTLLKIMHSGHDMYIDIFIITMIINSPQVRL